MENPYKVIATRQHEKLKLKSEMFRLICDSYTGGNQYISSNHLFQYVKEGSTEFAQRQKRSFYFNFIQPIVDTLTGFIYSTKPTRKIPDKIKYIFDKCSKDKSLDAFMENVAIHSQQYVCAVLVDSPKFDPDEVKTEADRLEKGNPFCLLYYPWQIRDFYLDEQGGLEWIILDNSETEKDDPFSEPYLEEKYSLWTKNDYYCIKVEKKSDGKYDYILDEKFTHGLGVNPVILHNFRDKNEDGISETPFENTAILSRTIYNWLSCFDEMIHSGSFKMLFVPIEQQNDLPQSLLSSGVGSLSVFPYNGKFSTPEFKGSGLEDINPFISAIDMCLKQIYSTFGLDKDTDKMYVQSGIAKSKEFEKCEAFLRGGASQLEALEIGIMQRLCLWEGIPTPEIEITYQKSFNQEEINNVLTRLYQSMMLPYKSIQSLSEREIVKKTFSYLDAEEITKIISEMEKEQAKKITVTPEQITNEANARKTQPAKG
jgi:hypothetical protein